MAKKKFFNIKTTGNRPYNQNYIEYIENGLIKRGFDNDQIDIILGNIIEESGGDPFAKSKGNTYQGLLQWAKDRYVISKEKDAYKEIDNQLDYLASSIKNTTDKKSWTHGGSGTGYNSWTEPFNIFHNSKSSIEEKHKAFTLGYIRPLGRVKSSNNRYKVVKQLKDNRNYDKETAENTESNINSIDTNNTIVKPYLSNIIENDIKFSVDNAKIGTIIVRPTNDMNRSKNLFLKQNRHKFDTGGIIESNISPVQIIRKGRKLPKPNTSKGRDQAKWYVSRILNGDMDISAIPKEYKTSVSNYLKSKPIEQAARDRKGYEGLNEFMYTATGGFPGLLSDVASRSAGWFTDKAFDIAGASEDSKARQYTKLATEIAAGLYAGGKTAWNDIGASQKILSATYRPKVRYKYHDIYDIFNGDILQAQQLINSGLLGDKTQLSTQLHIIKRALAQENYNSKTNYKLDGAELVHLINILNRNRKTNSTIDYYINRVNLHDPIDYYINRANLYEPNYNKKALNYISKLDAKIKSNYNYLFKDKPNIQEILKKSPEYTKDAIRLAEEGYSEEDIIKQLIIQKHTFARGVNVRGNVDKPIEDYFLELISDTGGGRADHIRGLGTIYTANSINTAAGYTYREAKGTSMLGIIRRKPEYLNFDGDISTWWDNNPIYKRANEITSKNDISMDKARSTSRQSTVYRRINEIRDLLSSDEYNLNRIIRSKYVNQEILDAIHSLDVYYPEPKYNHFVFEGPSGTKLNEYELYKVYIDEEIDDLIKGMYNIHRGHSNTVTPGFSLGNRFGGIIPSRRKYDYGGISAPGYTSYGSSTNAGDVDSDLTSADGEGIVGASAGQGAQIGSSIGLGVGATAAAAGLASGAAIGSWLGPIGMAAGALIGGIIGLFGGKKKKRREERRRAEVIAQQQELGRQAIIGNMESKEESDVSQLRQTAIDTSENTSFYNKFGGVIPHRKLFGNGGQIIQNSSNTAMAYGPSHENGGIDYGPNAEIEGGEAIRKTSIGDQIYSDKLFIPGTRMTFADGAKLLSDIKGIKEQEVKSRGARILGQLEELDRTRVNKLAMGTLSRNIEKDAFYMDKAAGQTIVLDKKLNDLFNGQELIATMKGLRGNPMIAKYGGCVRKKYWTGGINDSDTDDSDTDDSDTDDKGLNLNTIGLGINVLGTGLGMLSSGFATRRARKNLEWQMNNLTPTQQPKLIAPKYSTNYNINQELQDLISQERRTQQYIKSNTSNPILARNAMTKLAIDAMRVRNKLYSAKRDYQQQRYDMNINARTETANKNRQLSYLDAEALRQHNMSYMKAIGNVQMQGYNTINSYIGDLMTTANQYLTGEVSNKLWPTGVQDTMNGGKKYGGIIIGRRK